MQSNILPRYVVLEKPVGQTPLQAVEEFRNGKSELKNLSLTYAGRLDPMAEGKLLILIGDECKKRKEYDGLDKEYEFEILLGFKSDTGDILGIAETSQDFKKPTETEIKKVAQSYVGIHTLPYPAFSSKTVDGVPLFEHALLGTLDVAQMPRRQMRIYRMEYLESRILRRLDLIEDILKKINLLKVDADPQRVGSDFRKGAIEALWRELAESGNDECLIVRFKTTVSAGTYIRTLAPLIADSLGTIGLAYSIHRTEIGRYQPLIKGFGFWKNRF